jgi:hypothetical protein
VLHARGATEGVQRKVLDALQDKNVRTSKLEGIVVALVDVRAPVLVIARATDGRRSVGGLRPGRDFKGAQRRGPSVIPIGSENKRAQRMAARREEERAPVALHGAWLVGLLADHDEGRCRAID